MKHLIWLLLIASTPAFSQTTRVIYDENSDTLVLGESGTVCRFHLVSDIPFTIQNGGGPGNPQFNMVLGDQGGYFSFVADSEGNITQNYLVEIHYTNVPGPQGQTFELVQPRVEVITDSVLRIYPRSLTLNLKPDTASRSWKGTVPFKVINNIPDSTIVRTFLLEGPAVDSLTYGFQYNGGVALPQTARPRVDTPNLVLTIEKRGSSAYHDEFDTVNVVVHATVRGKDTVLTAPLVLHSLAPDFKIVRFADGDSARLIARPGQNAATSVNIIESHSTQLITTGPSPDWLTLTSVQNRDTVASLSFSAMARKGSVKHARIKLFFESPDFYGDPRRDSLTYDVGLWSLDTDRTALWDATLLPKGPRLGAIRECADNAMTWPAVDSGFYQSNNEGGLWTLMKSPPHTISAIRLLNGVYVCLTSDSTLYRSTDGGQAWQSLADTLSRIEFQYSPNQQKDYEFKYLTLSGKSRAIALGHYLFQYASVGWTYVTNVVSCSNGYDWSAPQTSPNVGDSNLRIPAFAIDSFENFLGYDNIDHAFRGDWTSKLSPLDLEVSSDQTKIVGLEGAGILELSDSSFDQTFMLGTIPLLAVDRQHNVYASDGISIFGWNAEDSSWSVITGNIPRTNVQQLFVDREGHVVARTSDSIYILKSSKLGVRETASKTTRAIRLECIAASLEHGIDARVESAGTADLMLCDTRGVVVKRTSLPSNGSELTVAHIDCAGVSAGAYYLLLRTPYGSKTCGISLEQ